MAGNCQGPHWFTTLVDDSTTTCSTPRVTDRLVLVEILIPSPATARLVPRPAHTSPVITIATALYSFLFM